MKPTPRLVWLILLAAFALRAATAFVVDWHVKSAGRQFLIEGDANGYWELAIRLTEGRDYCLHHPPRYILRTPGFPLLLAGCMIVVGQSELRVSLILAAIGTACVWLTWKLARKCVPETTAIVAAAMMAISPLQIGNSVLILSETWFTFWLLLSLLALQRLLPLRNPDAAIPARDSAISNDASALTPTSESVWPALQSGLVTGITVLVRPGWILWPVVSGLLLLVFGKAKLPRKFLQIAAIGIGCLLALTPWAWRNYQVSGHWILTSLWSGPSLYDGLHPQATGASDMTFVDSEPVYATMSEYDANAHYKQRAMEFVRENPGRTMELAVIKAGRFLSLTPNASGFSGGPASLICLAYYSCFFCLIFAGGWQFRRNPAVLALLAAPFMQFLLVHMVFVGSVRYRLPVEFPLSVLASNGLVALWGLFRQSQQKAADT